MNDSSRLGAFLLACSLCAPASAETLMLLGGNANTDGDLYGYVGAVVPLGSNLDDDGFKLRLWLDGVTFDYRTVIAGRNAQVDGDGYSVEGALGYQVSGGGTRLTGYLGMKYRDIDLDPEDATSDVDNVDLGVKGQLELYSALSDRFSVSAIGSYVYNFDDYWFRLRPGFRLTDRITLGPELVLLGGEKYDKQQLGLFANGFQIGSAGLGVKAGAERDSRQNETHAYGGLELHFRF